MHEHTPAKSVSFPPSKYEQEFEIVEFETCECGAVRELGIRNGITVECTDWYIPQTYNVD